MPLSKVLFYSTVELHLDMERVAIESRATIIKLLQDLEKELIAKVADGVTDWSKARIAKQLSEADAVIRQYYDDAAGIARDTTTSVAQVSASATATSLSVAVGGQVAIGVLPTAAYLETLAGNTIIQGAIQADWWERQAGDTAFKFQSAVRQGLVAAETTPQIVKRVRDVMDLSRRNAETLVHTSVQSVANTTREKIFDDNNDVISGKEWSAALDRRTCPTCGVRDGKRWDTKGKPIGHSIPYTMPPQHFRCRCSMVPVLKTWKELGINMDELPESTRASMDGQVTDKTFADWLKRKESGTPGFADNTLGKGRAALFRDGKITMDQMISGGKPLTLVELKKKYIGVESKIMTLDEVYKRAEKYKPDFDYKIKQWANEFNATPILTNLKDKSRAKDKIDRLYEGNTDSIRDILRATLLVDSNNKLSVLLSEIKSKIGSDIIDIRNNYDKNHNSSDGYYDAKIDFVFNGIKTELQIHTISMYTAKEKAHILYEKRQAILKTGYKLTNDQRNEIKNINNAMREIFKGAK